LKKVEIASNLIDATIMTSRIATVENSSGDNKAN